MTEENTGVTEQVAEAQAPKEQVNNDREINFAALRDKTENLERQNQFLQMKLFEQQKMQEQSMQQRQPEFDLSQVRDEDIPTYGELKKVMENYDKRQKQYLEKIQQLEIKSKYGDYNDTINKYLPDVLQDDPDLAEAIKDNPMMHKLAYKLAQASPRYHQEKLAKQNVSGAERMQENSSRPQPAMARKNVAINDEDAKYSNMSDDQLWSVFQMAKARA
jgi:hypothetical protein